MRTDQRMRHLLKTGRRASGGLSQRTAAARAGISAVYWQRIESGSQVTVPAATLAAMFMAAGITAGRLRDEGYAAVADALDELADITAAGTSPEDHLAATPGASAEEITALQAVWRALTARRTADPIEGDFEQGSRRGHDQH